MLFCVGVSYRQAKADVRDHVAFTAESARAFRGKLTAAGIVQSLVLSTCNRTETFCFASPDLVTVARRLFEAEFSTVDLSQCLRVRDGREAMVYLCRIAAGLESMVLGEYQILGQVKEAHAAALASGHVGKELDRIVRDAVSAAKRVKTELDIGAVPPSVCLAGMEHVERLNGLVGKRVFVIGSGKTGTLAVRYSKEKGAASVAVCNRSPERARHLELEYGACVVDYAARYDVIAASDVVVSATASPHVVVRANQVKLNHPVCFLDLASPRDVEPSLADNPLATLVSIDTIGELAAGDREERERLTALGARIVEAHVDATMSWLDSLSHEADFRRTCS